MRSQSRTAVVLLKMSVMVTTARQRVGVTHRMATQRHFGVLTVKTIVLIMVAADAAVLADCSRTARALAILDVDATADVTADATAVAVAGLLDDSRAGSAVAVATVDVCQTRRSPAIVAAIPIVADAGKANAN